MNNNLIKSPLFEEIRNYLTSADHDKQIFLYVPYIKTSTLEQLIEGIINKIIIVTDWSKRNLLSGASELKLYSFCKERKITLYHNEKLHLKVYSVNFENMILSTGNISERGLMEDGNLELGTLVENISIEDRLFFERIRQKSVLINEKIYQELLKWSEDNSPISIKDEKFPDSENEFKKDEFLISALPMTRKVSILQQSYDQLNHQITNQSDRETNDCVYHDLVNYDISLGLSNDEFLKLLKIKFFKHPFIKKIDEFITREGTFFGRIKEWVQTNCADVPIPSRRELTGNVQVLLEWFEKLGDGTYVIDVPGEHSQRIRRV